MIKLIVFDLDGVLVDARDIHYRAMNYALRYLGFDEIPREKHLAKFDGLPTTKKLQMLEEECPTIGPLKQQIWREKQKATQSIIRLMEEDVEKRSMLQALGHCQIFCASNSVRQSVKMMLLKRGLLEFIDEYFSNEDVKNPKPHPEMYLKCMLKAGVRPDETLVIEDSHIGRAAAIASGAHVLGVENPDAVTLAKIWEKIEEIENKEKVIKPPWQGGKMNVVIPAAGAGSRFAKAGFSFPKPLIEVHHKPMLQLVVESLNIDATFTFIVQREHYDRYRLKHLLNLISPDCNIVCVDELTEGAACTVLLAKEFINNDEPLLIANSDQYLDWESNEFMWSMQGDGIDGGILCFEGSHPKWSFAKLDDDGFVCEVAEKKVISNNATAGIYFFTKGKDFVNAAEQMIKKDVRTNNEFYVCPVYNEMIKDGKKIKIFNLEQEPGSKLWGLGTPEELSYFLNHFERK